LKIGPHLPKLLGLSNIMWLTFLGHSVDSGRIIEY